MNAVPYRRALGRILSFALTLAVGLAPGAWPPAAHAQPTYPDRPVRLVVPFPPGGGADNLARAIVPRASQALGQSIVIDNKPGAGGNIGAAEVARAAPDGYTLLYGTNGTHGINQALYANPGFDPVRDFVPVARLTVIPAMLVVHPSVPAGSVAELVAYLKANPNKVSFASAGNGTTSHLAGVMFRNLTGTDIQHIPYKGGGPAMTGLLAGDVQMMIDLMVSVYPNARAGKLKGLAVTTRQRVTSAPDLPTLDEAGVPGFDLAASDGIYAPAGTPRAIVDRLNAAFRQALEDSAVRDSLVSRGAFPMPGSPEDLARHIAREYPVWVKLVKDSGAKVD
jgi:tripartite-type tricarboxylate transporter receptor subunit TctC